MYMCVQNWFRVLVFSTKSRRVNPATDLGKLISAASIRTASLSSYYRYNMLYYHTTKFGSVLLKISYYSARPLGFTIYLLYLIIYFILTIVYCLLFTYIVGHRYAFLYFTIHWVLHATCFCPPNAIPLAQDQHITVCYTRIGLSDVRVSSRWAFKVPSSCVISGYHSSVIEIVAPLECYVA